MMISYEELKEVWYLSQFFLDGCTVQLSLYTWGLWGSRNYWVRPVCPFRRVRFPELLSFAPGLAHGGLGGEQACLFVEGVSSHSVAFREKKRP